MTTPTNPIAPFSPFLPAVSVVPEEEDRRRTYLTDKFSSYADVINNKKIGAYTQAAENINGELWSYQSTKKVRNGYQSIAYIPILPNAGVLVLTRDTVPQFPIEDINEQFVISMLYGTASKPPTAVNAGDGDFFAYNNRGDPRITFDMSDTTITITTTVDLRAYSGFIIVHYIKNGKP